MMEIGSLNGPLENILKFKLQLAIQRIESKFFKRAKAIWIIEFYKMVKKYLINSGN